MGSTNQNWIEEAAATWIARRDAGEWTQADEVELEQWLEASTAHRVAYLRLKAVWERADRLRALGARVAPGVVPERGKWGSRCFP